MCKLSELSAGTRDADDIHAEMYPVENVHWIRIELSKDKVKVDANAERKVIAEIVQQVCWMSLALSWSQNSDEIVSGRIEVLKTNETPSFLTKLNFRLAFTPLNGEQQSPCWLPLFQRVVIVDGFPLPERSGGALGLEIPLRFMTELCGAIHAVEFDGGVIMKGFSTMLIPVQRYDDVIQWHLIFNDNLDDRLSYADGVSRCGKRLSLDEFGLNALATTRAVLGWCNPADIILGKPELDYDCISYSKCEVAKSIVRIPELTLGVQHIVSGAVKVSVGSKLSKYHLPRTGPYYSIINCASRTPVLLFDTDARDRRAWLVSASQLMLHIAQHRNISGDFTFGGKAIYIPFEGSAEDTLKKCVSMILSDADNYLFKDMILGIWSIIEYLIDQKVQRDSSPDGEVALRDLLYGFEYKAVVEQRSPFHLKQTHVAKTSGGWPKLVRDIDALILFGSGFGNVILPRMNESRSLCHKWQTLPQEKDYMATTVSMLDDLYDVAGCGLDHEYLTSTKLQWHRGSSLFEHCETPRSYICSCNRLQQIVPKLAVGKAVRPGKPPSDGAVIFGFSGTMVDKIIPTSQPKSNSLYSQPNSNFATAVYSEDFHCSPSGTADQLSRYKP